LKEESASTRIHAIRTRVVHDYRHRSPLIGCRFDPTGRFVFAGAQDNTIQRWELSNARQTTLTGHRSWVRGLAFNVNNRLLFSADFSGRVLCWSFDAAAPVVQRSIEAHRGVARMLTVSPDGRVLASCGNDRSVRLWNTADGRLIRELNGHDCHVYNVDCHPGGQSLVSGDLRGIIKQWDVERGTDIRSFDAGSILYRRSATGIEIGGIRGMAFNASGSRLACCGITDVTAPNAGIGKPAVVLFDWASARRQILRPRIGFKGTAWGVGFHPSGIVVAAGGGDGGAIWFWRTNQENAFHTIRLPNNARDLHLHPDGRRLAVAMADGVLRVYDISGA
jgi:WD40 repeat protein